MRRHRHMRPIAPLAFAVALSFGMAACQGSYEAGDGTEQVEGEVDTTDTGEDAPGGATGDSGY